MSVVTTAIRPLLNVRIAGADEDYARAGWLSLKLAPDWIAFCAVRDDRAARPRLSCTMPDSVLQRVSSFHLEDLAIVALASPACEAGVVLHPELDALRRGRLRARLKQMGRLHWPSDLEEDPLLRRGYTLRQCLRLVAALMLIDAHLAPTDAIAVARANELDMLRAIAPRLGTDGRTPKARSTDLLIVLALGELVDIIEPEAWRAARPGILRHVARGDLALLWSSEADLAVAGQRLVVDFGVAAGRVWHWLLERELMTSAALEDLMLALDADAPSQGRPPTPPHQRQGLG